MNDQESERLAALRRYGILDTEAETVFDELVELASAICGTPISLVSLVDAERQWFKAKTGILVNETPRDISFCAQAITQREIFIVEDATKDVRFCDNPVVRQTPPIRFYAGVPLISDNGYALGTLCVVDYVPRKLEMRQVRALEVLGHQAQALLERRLYQRKLAVSLEDGAAARRAFQIEHSRLLNVAEEQNIGWFEWAGEIEGMLFGGKLEALIDVDQGCQERGIARLTNHVHPDDRDSLLAALGTALNSVGPLRKCFRTITRDGSVRWLECVAHGVPPLPIRSARLFGTVREITGAVELQSRLENKRAVLETMTEVLPIAIAYVSATRVVRWANLHYAKYVGQTRNYIIGRKLEEILSPQQFAGIEDSVTRVLGGHQVFREEHIVGADFKTITWEKTLVPSFNGDGAVVGFVFFARDIGVEVGAREGCENRERRVREVVHNVPAMIWVADAQASNNYVSAEFLRFCGRPVADLLGHAWENLVHPEDAGVVVSERRAAIANKLDFAVQYRMRRADGEYCRVLDLGRPVVDDAGSGWQYFGTCVPLESAGRNTVTGQAGVYARATEPRKDTFSDLEP